MYADGLRRIVVANNEVERMALKYIIKNKEMPQKTRLLAQFRLSEMPAAWSENRIARLCTMTGKGRAVIREFNINRMRFREMALEGRLTGITKSSW